MTLDPVDFVGMIDNPYWPMVPGTRWENREADTHGNEQTVIVKVKQRTKGITGISATVVRDTVTEDGELVEDTFDWYAQDVCGNVWYLGENTKEYEDGVLVSTESSWGHGVGGALAGVIVPAGPQVGLAYRQEYLAGEAEDTAEVLSLAERAQVPFGHFTEVLLPKSSQPCNAGCSSTSSTRRAWGRCSRSAFRAGRTGRNSSPSSCWFRR